MPERASLPCGNFLDSLCPPGFLDRGTDEETDARCSALNIALLTHGVRGLGSSLAERRPHFACFTLPWGRRHRARSTRPRLPARLSSHRLSPREGNVVGNRVPTGRWGEPKGNSGRRGRCLLCPPNQPVHWLPSCDIEDSDKLDSSTISHLLRGGESRGDYLSILRVRGDGEQFSSPKYTFFFFTLVILT